MGTRGTYGWRLDGHDYLAYNHFDSYPPGLGTEIAAQLAELLADNTTDELRSQVRALRAVSEDSTPTPEDIAKCRQYADLSVDNRRIDNWYCLLRKAQGDMGAMLATGILLDANYFIRDSLFCEWGYVANLDDSILEVWRGFQEESDPTNRYGQDGKPCYEGGPVYYPCTCIATLPLDAGVFTAFDAWRAVYEEPEETEDQDA